MDHFPHTEADRLAQDIQAKQRDLTDRWMALRSLRLMALSIPGAIEVLDGTFNGKHEQFKAEFDELLGLQGRYLEMRHLSLTTPGGSNQVVAASSTVGTAFTPFALTGESTRTIIPGNGNAICGYPLIPNTTSYVVEQTDAGPLSFDANDG